MQNLKKKIVTLITIRIGHKSFKFVPCRHYFMTDFVAFKFETTYSDCFVKLLAFKIVPTVKSRAVARLG